MSLEPLEKLKAILEKKMLDRRRDVIRLLKRNVNVMTDYKNNVYVIYSDVYSCDDILILKKGKISDHGKSACRFSKECPNDFAAESIDKAILYDYFRSQSVEQMMKNIRIINDWKEIILFPIS